MQLNDIVERIERAFGETPDFLNLPLSQGDLETLHRVFSAEVYQSFLQDEINRHIIRDYLSNALLLGYLPEQGLGDYAQQMATTQGRSALALHMLMSSVEDAVALPTDDEPDALQALRPEPDSPPYITLVPG